MEPIGYSDTEADQLLGKCLQMAAEGEYVPRGARGKVAGKRRTDTQGFAVLVNWEVNPMFVSPVPVQIMYSRVEFTKLVRVVE